MYSMEINNRIHRARIDFHFRISIGENIIIDGKGGGGNLSSADRINSWIDCIWIWIWMIACMKCKFVCDMSASNKLFAARERMNAKFIHSTHICVHRRPARFYLSPSLICFFFLVFLCTTWPILIAGVSQMVQRLETISCHRITIHVRTWFECKDEAMFAPAIRRMQHNVKWINGYMSRSAIRIRVTETDMGRMCIAIDWRRRTNEEIRCTSITVNCFNTYNFIARLRRRSNRQDGDDDDDNEKSNHFNGDNFFSTFKSHARHRIAHRDTGSWSSRNCVRSTHTHAETPNPIATQIDYVRTTYLRLKTPLNVFLLLLRCRLSQSTFYTHTHTDPNDVKTQ